MHNYSIDSNKRIQFTTYITLISVVMIFLIGIILNIFNIDFMPLEINIKTIGVLILKMFTLGITIFGGIYWVFDVYLWKWGIFTKLHKIPNLNGTWNGIFESSKKDKGGLNYTGQCKMFIEQNWSKIKITCHFNQSISDSKTATIKVNGSEGIELSFDYYNNAQKTNGTTMKSHNGFNKLRYINDEDTLVGEYFNDKNRTTTGYLEVVRLINTNN